MIPRPNPTKESIMDLDTYLTEVHLKLQGWCSVEKALDMVSLINRQKPQLCVELGVFGGRSLFPVGFALKRLGGGRVIGIDPWAKSSAVEGSLDKAQEDWWSSLSYENIYSECVDNNTTLGLTEHVEIWRETASSALSKFSDESIDILHIDGNHTVESSVRDVYEWLPKVRPGGYIWFDDLDWVSTSVAVLLLSVLCKRCNSNTTYGLFQKPESSK